MNGGNVAKLPVMVYFEVYLSRYLSGYRIF